MTYAIIIIVEGTSFVNPCDKGRRMVPKTSKAIAINRKKYSLIYILSRLNQSKSNLRPKDFKRSNNPFLDIFTKTIEGVYANQIYHCYK